ncbi:hypothetical protein KR018_009185 [Drosophila ironensis]|nr:hypothetical protein KR018_009185 [Drosophila ironensis]
MAAGTWISSEPRLQLLLLAGLVLASSSASAAPEGGVARWNVLGLSPGQQVLAAVPASERLGFLLYQLALPINPAAAEQLEEVQVVEQQEFLDPNWLAAMANEFQNVPVYESFPLDLRHWLMDSYGISATDVFHSWSAMTRNGQARSGHKSNPRSQVICTTEGQCYEVNKIVTTCCPF